MLGEISVTTIPLAKVPASKKRSGSKIGRPDKYFYISKTYGGKISVTESACVKRRFDGTQVCAQPIEGRLDRLLHIISRLVS